MGTSSTNRHGLKRHIPASIRKKIRQECGFGCVRCGRAIVQYEHFDPPFEDARAHTVKGIALLCGACHDRKTRGFLSTEAIAQARVKPITFQNGEARDALDISPPFVLRVGNSVIRNVSSIVRTHEGERWFSIEAPEEEGAPMRLSAQFFDGAGAPSLILTENEWITFPNQWDVDVTGNKVTIRSGPGRIMLMFETHPPHELALTRLKMLKGNLGIDVQAPGQIAVHRDGGVTEFESTVISGADCVFLI